MNVLHIAQRELRERFNSAVGWFVLCGYLFVTGVFWIAMVENYVVQSSDVVFNPYAAAQLNLSHYLLVPFYGNCIVILLMATPAIGMGLVAREVQNRTLELLLTSPISTLEIVAGKFLGALGFLLVLMLFSLHYPLWLMAFGSPDLGVLFGCHLALFLTGGMLLAFGMMFSALTSSQTAALIQTFALALVLFVLDWSADSPDAWNARLALSTHVTDMMQGSIKLSDIAYFFCMGGVALFGSLLRIESYRWS